MNELLNMEDYTPAFDPMDIEANKGISVLSYLGILFLIPMLSRQNSRFARFHVNQGLILLITEAAYNIVVRIVRAIPVIRMLGGILGFLDIIFLILMILGIVNAAKGQAKELPVIGKLRLLNY